MPLVLRTVFALRQTAEEQSAAFVLVSELPDTNALDYVGCHSVVWSKKDNIFQTASPHFFGNSFYIRLLRNGNIG